MPMPAGPQSKSKICRVSEDTRLFRPFSGICVAAEGILRYTGRQRREGCTVEAYMNEILDDGWSVERCIDTGKLLQYTTRITQYDAMKRKWPNLRELHLLGASDYQPKDKRLEPGCYVNREESWLLIIGAKSEAVNRIVSRYGAGLKCWISGSPIWKTSW
jgi:hypothetical protein